MRPNGLVVDNDRTTREILSRVLQRHLSMLTIDTAESYRDTWKYLHGQAYSVVLADARTDGFAVLARVRAVQPHTPVIMMSGSTDVLAGAFAAGAFDILRKPFPRETLIATFCQALRAHSLGRDIQAADQRLRRFQQRLARQQSHFITLRRQADGVVNPVLAESRILCSRAVAAMDHTKMMLDENEKRKRVLREALRGIRDNSRRAALRRLKASA